MSLHNELISQMRGESSRAIRHKNYGQKWPATELPYEEYLIRRQSGLEQQEQIQKALKALTPRQRELLQLKYFDDLTYDEISIQCGISKRTAYNIIQKGLVLLKAYLRPPEK